LNGYTLFKYNAHEISIFGKSLHVGTNWSKKHSLTLHFTLKSILPLDVINHIESFIPLTYQYLYWIPLEPFKSWNEPRFKSFYKFSKDISAKKILTDPQLNGKVYTLEKKIYVVQFPGVIKEDILVNMSKIEAE